LLAWFNLKEFCRLLNFRHYCRAAIQVLLWIHSHSFSSACCESIHFLWLYADCSPALVVVVVLVLVVLSASRTCAASSTYR